jgi:hypothetical protein
MIWINMISVWLVWLSPLLLVLLVAVTEVPGEVLE